MPSEELLLSVLAAADATVVLANADVVGDVSVVRVFAEKLLDPA